MRVPVEALQVEPQLIAQGMFWSLALSDDRVFTIASYRNNRVIPETADVLSFDLTSLERHVLFSQADGLQDPAALLMHGENLYVHDWEAGSLYQVPLRHPELTLLATGLGGGLELERHAASVFLGDYFGGQIYRVRDEEASANVLAGAPLDATSIVVEEIGAVTSPTGMAAWEGHAAWGTNGGNATVPKQLIIRNLGEAVDLAIDVVGSVAAIDASGAELAWATYGVPRSEMSRMPLDQTGAPMPGELDSLTTCGQPTSAILSGTLAVYGGSGLMLWERGARTLQVLQTGFVRYLAADATHIYFVNWDGLYRIPRPARD